MRVMRRLRATPLDVRGRIADANGARFHGQAKVLSIVAIDENRFLCHVRPRSGRKNEGHPGQSVNAELGMLKNDNNTYFASRAVTYPAFRTGVFSTVLPEFRMKSRR